MMVGTKLPDSLLNSKTERKQEREKEREKEEEKVKGERKVGEVDGRYLASRTAC